MAPSLTSLRIAAISTASTLGASLEVSIAKVTEALDARILAVSYRGIALAFDPFSR